MATANDYNHKIITHSKMFILLSFINAMLHCRDAENAGPELRHPQPK